MKMFFKDNVVELQNFGTAKEGQREPSFHDVLGPASSFPEEERRMWKSWYVDNDSKIYFGSVLSKWWKPKTAS